MASSVVPEQSIPAVSSLTNEPARRGSSLRRRKTSKTSQNQAGVEKEPPVTGWTAAQLKLKTNKTYRHAVTATLLLYSFIDILGTVLFTPFGPTLCQLAEGGPMDFYARLMYLPNSTDWVEYGLPQEFADFHASSELQRMTLPPDEMKIYVWENLGNPNAFESMPVGYGMSVNLLTLAGTLSTGIGSAGWGALADKTGMRKVCMMIGLVGGIGGYAVMYLSGAEWHSYELFMLGTIMNGLFSASDVLSQSFIATMYTKEDAEMPLGIMMGAQAMGGAAGALLLIPFIQDGGKNMFDAGWVGIIGSVVALALVTFLLEEPRKSKVKESTDASNEKDDGQLKFVPKMVSRILWIALAGSLLDSAGDTGTGIAMSTVMTAKWPESATVNVQNNIIIGMIALIIFFVLPLFKVIGKYLGKGAACVIGAAATAVCQGLLGFTDIKTYPVYLAVYYAGMGFGNLSTFGSDMIIRDKAPAHVKGTWIGRSALTSGFSSGLITFAMALNYDAVMKSTTEDPGASAEDFEDALRGRSTILITLVCSIAATLAYMPLLSLVPREGKTDKQKEKEYRSVEEFEALSEKEIRNLPMAEIDFIETKRLLAGKQPTTMRWGTYEEDLPYLQGKIDRSIKDFEYMQQTLVQSLSSAEKINEAKQMFPTMIEHLESISNIDKERAAMGNWVADYFDDAGYEWWLSDPNGFKMLIMNAFPPIDKLDGTKQDLRSVDVEEMLVLWLKIANMHVKSRNAQVSMLATLKKDFNVKSLWKRG